MELIKNLKWRYATKKFDPTKKVSKEDLSKLKEVIRLSASSYGLQLYKVLIIEDLEIRNKLKPVSWNQSQIVDASHLFVFCNYTDASPKAIDDFVIHTSVTRKQDLQKLKVYGDFIKSKLADKSNEEKTSWLKSQTYLALGNLLNACAELKIDACPMEGFEPEAYNEILGLEAQKLNAAVIAPVGYRHKEDYSTSFKKVRKSMKNLFVEI